MKEIDNERLQVLSGDADILSDTEQLLKLFNKEDSQLNVLHSTCIVSAGLFHNWVHFLWQHTNLIWLIFVKMNIKEQPN